MQAGVASVVIEGLVLQTAEQRSRGEFGVSEIESKVREIVAEQLQVPVAEVTDEKAFIDDLKADSLDIVELVMAFEDAFKLTIPDDDYPKIKTVGDAIAYIKSHQS
jgi:acyl carrier protein